MACNGLKMGSFHLFRHPKWSRLIFGSKKQRSTKWVESGIFFGQGQLYPLERTADQIDQMRHCWFGWVPFRVLLGNSASPGGGGV